MEVKNVLVKNPHDFAVGFKYSDGTNREVVLKPGTTRNVDEITIQNIDATTVLFKHGFLTIVAEDKEVVAELGIEKDNPNALTMDKAREIMQYPRQDLEKALAKITQTHAKKKMIQAAAEDKNLNKTKQQVFLDVFGVNVYEEAAKYEGTTKE